MNLPTVLNIAIGLIIIYLVFSLIASEIQELIATLLEWRAKHLKNVIAQLLGKGSSDDPLVSKIYNNPLIQSLNHKSANTKKSTGPSYIPATSFSSALLEIIREGKDVYPTLAELMQDIENHSSLPDSLKKNLLSLSKRARSKVTDLSQQVNQLELEIENWFNSSMDRASGVYKRNAKGVALVIAFLIAILANVDTVYIVNSLAKDQVLRSTITNVAQQVVASNSCLQISEDEASKTKCLTGIQADVNQAVTDLSSLPVGWDLSNPLKKQFSPLGIESIVKTLVGWFLSSIAIAMGAPFWFQVLSLVVNVRNTGKKVDKTS
ncbi:MAG: hypothetical protein F6J86_18320 [Symploca sp. SIO1B1]|nr:hypothetical protein [Symploca sp. SIO1C2]NER49256.1 hypothetical protein [Symploca sp. SIO1A3]NER95765.1 hypothetical protein [Symploca sp. SIO1B1]